MFERKVQPRDELSDSSNYIINLDYYAMETEINTCTWSSSIHDKSRNRARKFNTILFYPSGMSFTISFRHRHSIISKLKTNNEMMQWKCTTTYQPLETHRLFHIKKKKHDTMMRISYQRSSELNKVLKHCTTSTLHIA